jgi:hypothetical protein
MVGWTQVQCKNEHVGGFWWGKFLKSGQQGETASIKSLTETGHEGYKLY